MKNDSKALMDVMERLRPWASADASVVIDPYKPAELGVCLVVLCYSRRASKETSFCASHRALVVASVKPPAIPSFSASKRLARDGVLVEQLDPAAPGADERRDAKAEDHRALGGLVEARPLADGAAEVVRADVLAQGIGHRNTPVGSGPTLAGPGLGPTSHLQNGSDNPGVTL